MNKPVLHLTLLLLFLPIGLIAQPYIEVVSPGEFTSWTTGTIKQITWEAQGVQSVDVEWCANFNFNVPISNNWQSIADDVPAGQGSVNWTVPAVSLGSNYIRIRIRDTSNPIVYDISDFDIYIISGGNINILQPAGGEVYESGDEHDNISWVATQELQAASVVFEFTTNGGTSWQEIDNWFQDNGFFNPSLSLASARTINWPIPSVNSDQCQVRIRTADGAINDVSELFSIRNAASKDIEVTDPDGGEVLPIGSNYTITWESKGINNVNIEYVDLFNYTYPGPNDWQTIATNIPAALGEYTWTTPALPLSAARVRIRDASNNTVYDISDYDFSSNPLSPALQIISPNGGEFWESGTTFHNISWVQQTNIGTVELFYSTDNGNSWEKIDNWINPTYASNLIGFTRSVQWPVPGTNASEVKIRIQSANDPSIMDESDAVFSIGNSAPRDIEVITPNGGETYPANQTAKIRWDAHDVNRVNIEYVSFFNFSYPGPNMWVSVANNVDAAIGQYDWQLPATSISLARIRITDASDADVYDISDNDFMILDYQPSIELYSPNGGEFLRSNSLYNNITWAASTELGQAEIKLEFSIDNGNTWNNIENIYLGSDPYSSRITAGLRSVNWEVPDLESDQCLVRISVVGLNNVADQSDAVFAIVNDPNTSILDPKYMVNFLFPNPTTGVLHWQPKTEVDQVIVYDIQGIPLHVHQSDGGILNLSELTEGVYYLQFYEQSGNFTGWQPIIIMR